MERIKDLAINYQHSKESYTEQKRLVYIMKMELEKLEKNKSTIEDKLRIIALKDEIKISESLVDDREVELIETTSNLLEALKAADINVDEEVPFHLHNNTYISVRRTGDDSIMLFGPYSRN